MTKRKKMGVAEKEPLGAQLDRARAALRLISPSVAKDIEPVLDRLGGPLGDRLIFVERLRPAVHRLGFLTDAAKQLVLLDLSDLLDCDEAEYRRTKERMYRALLTKPPEEDLKLRRRTGERQLAEGQRGGREVDWSRYGSPADASKKKTR